MTPINEERSAIETLMDEHRRIESAIGALLAFAEETSATGSDDRPELARFVTFISRYADARHHAKEEQVLFKAMIDAGFPSRSGPIAVMLMDHDAGRGHVVELRVLAEQATPWSATDRARLVAEANGYGSLLFAHIRKEDGVLYPMALEHLSAEAIAQVTRVCRAIDARWEESGEDQSLLATFEGLVARHPVTARAPQQQ